MKMAENKPKPLDLEILEEVLEVFKSSFEEFDKAKFDKDDILYLIQLTKKVIKRRLINACEFYLRYKDKPELLKKEQKIEFFNFVRSGKKYIDYNEWLFKFTFSHLRMLEEGGENGRK